MVFGALLAASRPAHAQQAASVEFQTAVPLAPLANPTGPNGPFGVALDKAGDLFVTDYNNNRVLEVPAGCSSVACQVTVPTTGLNNPTAVTVDPNGDVYVADYHNNRIVEVPWSGSAFGAQIILPGTGQNLPTGLALDATGDLYIANNDYVGTTPSRVVELPWNGSNYGTPITVVNWLGNPSGLAIDGAGDLFVTDVGANEVVELPKGCSSSSCQIVVTSGVSTNDPGVATDAAGDVFVAYFGGNKVVEIPSGCSSAACQIQIGYGLNEPAGVVVDAKGTVYIADYQNGQVEKVQLNSADFGPVNVGSSATVTAHFVFNASTTLDSSAPYSVLTQGTSGLEFVDAGSSTCSATTYNMGQSCVVEVNFTPARAGFVTGALILSDSSGNPVATVYLHGTGSGPQLTFAPGSKASIGSGLGSSSGITLDRKGNIYVADSVNRTVEELLAPSYTTTVSLGGSFSFSNPVGVAVDGVGNVFVADSGSAGIDEILAPGYTTVKTLGGGFNAPSGVTVDGSGNIYVADTGNNSLKEILEASGYATVNTLASTFSGPSGIAVDGNGNVYVSDTGNNAVKEIVAVNGTIPNSPTINTLANSFGAPDGVAVDAAGNVYVADRANDEVDELTAASGYATLASLGTGFAGPSGIGLDSNGDVYVGGPGNDRVVKLDYSDPPSLSFAANVGATSNPQPVTFTNVGNADLTFAAPSSGNNPNVSADFAIQTSGASISACPLLTSSSGPAALSAGTSCTDEVTFNSSVSGTFTGSLVATDDNLNASGSTQTITLTGIAAAITLNPTSLNSAQVGVGYNQSLAAGGGTAPYSFSVTQGSLPVGVGLSAPGELSGTPTSAGTFNFTVTATSADPIAGSQAYTLTVAAPAIALAPTSLPTGQVNMAYSQTLSATGGTAPYNYLVTSGALPAGITLSSSGLLTGTPTTSGTFTFTISATDSSTGTGAPFSASNSYTWTVNGLTVMIAPTILSAAQVSVAYSQTFTASGGVAPYKFAVTGTLPAGVTFNAATATLSGTPTAGGSFPISISATDSSTGSGPYSSTVNYSLMVNQGTAVLSFAPIPPQTYGNPPFNVSATSASSGAITYSIVSGPAAINPSTGMVTLNGAGLVTIEASQVATSSYNAVIAQTPINVARQGSVTSLTVNPLLLSLGKKVTFTATVSALVAGTPTGTVTFFNGTNQIGTAVTVTNGTATLVTSSLPAGLDIISAVYSGDGNFLGSSAALSSPIVVVGLDFSFLAAGTSSQTVTPGGAATFDFTLTPTSTDYPGPVSFSVVGLPAGATTTITPTTVSSAAGLQTVKLTIQSPTGSAGPIQTSELNRRYAPLALAFFVPLISLRRMRLKSQKKFSGFLSMILLCAVCLATWPLSGCGTVSGVLGHSYSVAVTATSGSMQHTAFVTFVVN